MSKKVYIGDGSYCYTENCSKHDTSESGQLTLRANEAARDGRVSDFLRLKEEAVEAAKRTGVASSTRLEYPSFSGSFEAPKPKPASPKPAPSRASQQLSTAQQQIARQQFMVRVREDIKSYSTNETTWDDKEFVKFHKDIGFPSYFTAPKGSVGLEYSRHAIEETKKDRYGRIPVLDKLNFDEYEIIETKYDKSSGLVSRILYRQKDSADNICLVVMPKKGAWTVVTTWFNERGDSHRTLDRSKYSTPHDNFKAKASA